MVGSMKTRGKTAAMAKSATAQSHSTHGPAIDMVAPPPLTTAPATAAEHGGTSHQGGLVTTADLGPVLEQLQAIPSLPPRSTHAPAHTSNETLARVQLGSTHFSPPDPRSQADLSLRVDQLAQRMDDQSNLMRQLFHQISLAQNLGLGQLGEERMMDERTGRQLNGYPAGQAGVGRQGEGQQLDRPTDMSQASASPTRSRLSSRNNMRERLGPRLDVHAHLGPQGNTNIHERLRPQGDQPDNPHNEDHEEGRSAAHSRRDGSRRPATENLLQAQSTNTPPRQRRREGRPSQTQEEVSQRRPNREGRQRDRPAMCMEDVEKLMNDRLRDLKTGGNLDDALCKEINQANSTPLTAEIEQAAPPKRFSTPSFTHFRGDSDPESHLKHFKSVMILHKVDDALMCRVFVVTLRGATQDWFHTLPSGTINSFKKLAYVFTKEYTSYRMIKKNPDHLYNLRKKSDESLRDYMKRFKAEKANIVRCDDRIASSAFKKGLLVEHDLYRELTIIPSQTLAEVYATAERHMLCDDDRIAAKKSTKQEDQPIKRAGDAAAGENYTKFTILIHQILAQVKNKPWVRRPPPLKGDPNKRDTSKYYAFHGTHGHTTNNCLAWKAHLEELVREGHCTEFIVKQAIQRIEDRDTAKESPQKVIRINTILADAKESRLTSKEKKRKIKQATMISQVSTDLPPAEDDPVIGFQKKDLIGLDMPHNDALVINIQITQAMVDRIHADEGSAANILQLAVIQQMGLEANINKSTKSLTGFNGATKVTVGTIDLDVYSPPVVCLQTFMVINEVSPYNGILGRPWIGMINAITSATHQKIWYPIPGSGVGQINSDQAMARKCSAQGLKKSKQAQFLPVSQADLKEQSKRQDQAEEVYPEFSLEEWWKPEEDVELIPLDPDQPDKKARIGSRLSPDEKVELTTFLQNNKDMSAWSPSDMNGIDPNIICHRLHVNPAYKPVAQKRPKRVAIIEAKIDKLLAAGFIEEVSYSEWLANVVLVAKQEKGKWRVCVDYTDLNKACPKDNFPLPRIDQLVDSSSGNQLLSFMDAYSGYNQILMHKDDKAKTSFIIKRGTYCYKVMPFELKNAGATYQRLVNKIFEEHIGKTMEVYVDDMLVKAPKRADHLKNLAEAFSLLRQYRMKLNPSKCTFGVSSGRFLGYLVTQRGIEAHPRQIKVILEMKSPSTVKEIQNLTGRATALNRLLSRSTDKCKPFFKALKKGQRDKWDEECEVAFQSLKAYLTSPPLLLKPVPGEDLFVYLVVSNSALIRKELGAQHPVFYTQKLSSMQRLVTQNWRNSFWLL
ncbi:unnamed protein product [Prunus armeniaca]